MNLLFLGDIVGKLGRKTIVKALAKLRADLELDLVIANAENLAHGKGVTKKTFKQVQDAGIDFFTSGNHIWKKEEGVEILNQKPTVIIRPANYPPGAPGSGYLKCLIPNTRSSMLLINLLGRGFMKGHFDCPFRKFDEIVKKHLRIKTVIVDFHAETTSEKIAMSWYIKDRATLLVGTHTHVPTADTKIIENKLGYVTDIGMVGARDGILGVEKQGIIKKFLTQLPEKHKMIDTGPSVLNSIFAKIQKGKCVEIKRVDIEVL